MSGTGTRRQGDPRLMTTFRNAAPSRLMRSEHFAPAPVQWRRLRGPCSTRRRAGWPWSGPTRAEIRGDGDCTLMEPPVPVTRPRALTDKIDSRRSVLGLSELIMEHLPIVNMTIPRWSAYRTFTRTEVPTLCVARMYAPSFSGASVHGYSPPAISHGLHHCIRHWVGSFFVFLI
jgi:hypothetical protein